MSRSKSGNQVMTLTLPRRTMASMAVFGRVKPWQGM
jgi:hypothetical protein